MTASLSRSILSPIVHNLNAFSQVSYGEIEIKVIIQELEIKVARESASALLVEWVVEILVSKCPVTSLPRRSTTSLGSFVYLYMISKLYQRLGKEIPLQRALTLANLS